MMESTRISRVVTNLCAVIVLLFAGVANASQGIWQVSASKSATARNTDKGLRYYRADPHALRNLLDLVPHKDSGDFSRQIELPMPDGSLARFQIVESPIMQDGLAERYPEIKTYKVFGIDDGYASGRVDITPRGFSGMLQTSQGRVFIDPDYASGQTDLYVSKYRHSAQSVPSFSCGARMSTKDFQSSAMTQKIAQRIPGQLLQYRLAVSATGEYVNAVFNAINPDPPVTQAQAAIVTAINRVNEIYESDLGITLMLVANNDQLIENGSNVSFTNFSPILMLNENQVWIDSQIGAAAYDIGHAFSTFGGGVAFLGSACNDPIKAKGVTGQGVPLGDPFYIDFVAHEIGHQFNAEHSFNGTTNSLTCGNGRNAATAFEPGSGSTIMAYAGICGVEDLQLNSDATFHAGSIAEIDSFSGAAGNCFVPIATIPVNNADPVIAPPVNDRTIPLNTSFVLAGSATDVESGTMLTYQWDQMDVGTATDPVTFGSDQGDNPLFRSYIPQNTGSRDFPALGTQLQSLYDDAEVVPCQARHLDFRLTVRDGDGGQAIEDVRINVSGGAGPFQVTSQALDETILASNGAFMVNWDVANTDIAPVSCPNVAIELLAFDDSSYTNHTVHTLVASTPNNGSVTIAPTADSLQSPARGRLRVRCLSNYFYALSQGNLQFVGTNVAPQTFFDASDSATFFNNNGTTGVVAPVCNVQSTGTIAERSSGGSGSGAFDYLWLLLMTGIIALARLCQRYGLQ